jgi:tetratricopeptide (TPR) repeat protein
VAIIIQSEQLGSSIADVLHVQADQMRGTALPGAEKARTVPIKMLIPLAFLIFPAIMAVLIGPAILHFYNYSSDHNIAQFHLYSLNHGSVRSIYVSKFTPNLPEDPFKDAMRHFHVGKWEDGLGKLTQLRETYPDSDDLEDLLQEMQMRAGMDDEEVLERNLRRRQRIKKLAIRLVFVGAVLSLAILGVRGYSNWIQLRWNSANKSIEEQVQQVELAMKFRQAQNLMLTGQGEMAESLFQEIAAANPTYPGLQDALQQSNSFAELNSKYNQALSLLEANNYLSALTLFEEIQSEDAQFKDISTQITDLKRLIFITDTQSQAERAFDKQDWDEAISVYETIRISDPDYNPELIELRLYESYVNAGLKVLDARTGKIDDLETAEPTSEKPYL